MIDDIYLDYNATTPLDPQVVDAILPYLISEFGNPSSSHSFGRKAKQAVETARGQIAELLKCRADEIYFTSGGTESNNLAIQGYAHAHKSKGRHIITSSVEHPAVLEVCKSLQRDGFKVSVLPVDQNGSVTFADVEKSIREDTILISIMHANNEVGTIEPIRELAEIAHSHNVMFHTDAAQSVGKIAVDVKELGVDLLSIAGHKLYAPKGIGALYIRDGIQIAKQMHGANHERNVRPGTENVAGIVGLGTASHLVYCHLKDYMQHYASTRDRLEKLLTDKRIDIKINGDIENRLPNTSSISFLGISALELMNAMPDVAVSAGSACHADRTAVSHVLQAMKVSDAFALGTIRFSTGRGTSVAEIQQIVDGLSSALKALNY